MSRRIVAFRTYIRKLGEMVDVTSIRFHHFNHHERTGRRGFGATCVEYFCTKTKKSQKLHAYSDLLQFTGFFDDNKVRIYQNDIVTVKGQLGVVEFSSNNPTFTQFADEHYLQYKEVPIIDIPKHYEIIVVGNIYENPELLEKTTL